MAGLKAGTTYAKATPAHGGVMCQHPSTLVVPTFRSA